VACRAGGNVEGKAADAGRNDRDQSTWSPKALTAGATTLLAFEQTRCLRSPRKTGLKTRFMSSQRCGGSGTWVAMSILPCPHLVPALPGARSRKQIALSAVQGADDDSASRKRPSARPRQRAAPSPVRFPWRGDCGPRAPRPGRTAAGLAVPAPAAPPDIVPGHAGGRGYCRRLDNAGGFGGRCRRSRAAGQPVLLLPGPRRRRGTRRDQYGAGGRRPDPRPVARVTPKQHTSDDRRLS
jgi:hypothetical protein